MEGRRGKGRERKGKGVGCGARSPAGARGLALAKDGSAYAVVQCLPATFVYWVETAKDTAKVAMECE